MTSQERPRLEKYVGIPYRLGGRGFDGADCIGLIWLFYRAEKGLNLPDGDGLAVYPGWHKDPGAKARYASAVAEGAAKAKASQVGIDQIKPDDILAFTRSAQDPKDDEHVTMLAIYLGQRRILLTTESVQTSHVVRLTDAWRDRFVKGYRLCQP